ncbi:MAG: hypothetical protein KDK39_01855 [Leptospiraceae bacterium]|nr:hypothetical protein [Leptospiraceae bacterium]
MVLSTTTALLAIEPQLEIPSPKGDPGPKSVLDGNPDRKNAPIENGALHPDIPGPRGRSLVSQPRRSKTRQTRGQPKKRSTGGNAAAKITLMTAAQAGHLQQLLDEIKTGNDSTRLPIEQAERPIAAFFQKGRLVAFDQACPIQFRSGQQKPGLPYTQWNISCWPGSPVVRLYKKEHALLPVLSQSQDLEVSLAAQLRLVRFQAKKGQIQWRWQVHALQPLNELRAAVWQKWPLPDWRQIEETVRDARQLAHLLRQLQANVKADRVNQLLRWWPELIPAGQAIQFGADCTIGTASMEAPAAVGYRAVQLNASCLPQPFNTIRLLLPVAHPVIKQLAESKKGQKWVMELKFSEIVYYDGQFQLLWDTILKARALPTL